MDRLPIALTAQNRYSVIFAFFQRNIAEQLTARIIVGFKTRPYILLNLQIQQGVL